MAGKYKTRQNEVIKKCLEENKDGYVTVQQVMDYLKNRDISVGLTTIYRQLDRLVDEGFVTKVNVEGKSGACYQWMPEQEDQDVIYIQCEKCGEVSTMECHHLAELYHHVESDHHFKVNTKKTVLYGRCDKCNK
jgi:Fur family ferric uptake transcriptional regulator